MATDRLSFLDASFLRLESPTTPLQAGGVAIFEPGLSFGDVHDTLLARLDRLPLARRRVRPAPLGARPAWVDDAEFDLSYHLRHAAVPAPGGDAELADFLARLMSRPLDRRRPLWELYVVEGLAGGRTGLFRKVHLATAGQDEDIFSVLLDDRLDRTREPVPTSPWRPEPPAGAVELAVEAVRDRAGKLLDIGRAAVELAAAPTRLAPSAAEAAGSAVRMAARVLRSAPASPLNSRLSPHRRYVMVRADLEDLRRVRRAHGGTINDAVVAVVGDAVGRLLRWRGHDTTDLDLRVMVPVRVQDPASARLSLVADRSREGATVTEARSMGDGVVGVLAPLPVMEIDSLARLYRVMGELAGLRESRQAVAAHELVQLAAFAPAVLHAMAARFASAEQRYNVALSNAPGPQAPRFLRGVRMEESYAFIPLAGDAALSVAVSSYDGGMFFGILGDRHAMPDLEVLGGFVREAVADLVATADAAAATRGP